jgi:molecular chaperone DnaK (HSP70)
LSDNIIRIAKPLDESSGHFVRLIAVHYLRKVTCGIFDTRTEEYYTSHDFQSEVELDIYQGDDPDALRNLHIGQFRVEGLQGVDGPNTVLCRMRLDLDGILHVTAIEKKTGLSKHVAISGATRKRDSAEIIRSKEELDRLFAGRVTELPSESAGQPTDIASSPAGNAPMTCAPASADASTDPAQALIERCRASMPSMHDDDREEAVNLIEAIISSRQSEDQASLNDSCKALSEFLFFIEGR